MRPVDLKKDVSILRMLERFRSSFGANAFHVVDNWDADLYAVGIANPQNHGRLVYISTFEKAPDEYFVELESDSGQAEDAYYRVVGRYESVPWNELVAIVARHIGLSGITTA